MEYPPNHRHLLVMRALILTLFLAFSASVEYGLRTLVVLARYRLDEQRRLRWPLLRRPAARLSSRARSAADRA